MSIPLANCAPAHHWRGTAYEDPTPAPEIPLRKADGTHFRLADWHGQPALIYFGYTHCPDVCPATLADLAWLRQELTAEGHQIRVAFITVDPSRDSPQAVADYLSNFDDQFVGLHGSDQQLAVAKEGYGIYSARDESGDEEHYTVTHTTRVFLVDAEGLLRASYSFGTPRQDFLNDLRYLLGS